jgi:7-cyano-7-deazaguanine synthase
MTTALLLSGGMDSTALAWMTKPDVAITIDYGQQAANAEHRAALAVASAIGAEHRFVAMRLSQLGSGDMAARAAHPDAPASDWWPFRNQMLLTIAGMAALQHGCNRLLIGTVATDAQHKDGTTAFVEQMDALMRWQEGGLRIEAPALAWTSTELIVRSGVPAEVLAWSHSCHKANTPCCACRGCFKQFEVLSALKAA